MPGSELNSVRTGGVTVSLGIAGCLLAAAASRFPQLQGTALCVPCLGCFRAAPEERLLFSGIEEEGTGLGTAVNQIWSCCLSGSLLLLPQPKLQLSKDISLIFISQKQRGCFGIAVEHCTHIVWYSPRKRGCRTGAGTDFPRHTMVLLSARSPQLLQSHPIPSQGPQHLAQCGSLALQAEESGLSELPAPRQGRCLSPSPHWAQRHFLTCALQLHQEFQRTQSSFPFFSCKELLP